MTAIVFVLLVITKRGMSHGARPARGTTSDLIRIRRSAVHDRAGSVELVEQRRRRKAAVEPHAELGVRQGLAQQDTQALEELDRPGGRRGIAGLQQRGTQVLLGLVVKGMHGRV